MVVALLFRCATAFGAPANDEERKFDHSLRRQVKQGSSSERVQVIVKPKRGARNRMLKRLIDNGAKVNGQYGLTDGIVVSLPKGLAKKMTADMDVESISSDAPVYADGLAVQAIGSAGNSPYSLRGTLGLETVS